MLMGRSVGLMQQFVLLLERLALWKKKKKKKKKKRGITRA